MKNNETIFVKKYINLYEKAQCFGFTPSNFVYNPEKLKKDNQRKLKVQKFGLITLLLFFIQSYFIIKYYDKIILKIASFYNEEAECLVETPTPISDLFLPPIDCSFCRNLNGEIKRIKNVDKEIFEEMYAYSGIPVVVTDATGDWKAMTDFNIEFFASLYSNDSLPNDCQFFSYESKLENISQALHPDNFPNSTSARHSWYFGWGNCNNRVTDILRKYYSYPYFLPEQSWSGNVDWIFMGFAGKGAPQHLDRVGDASWQAQIKGSKLWRLTPPPECYYECPASAADVLLQEGEIIVVDTNIWYHSTEIMGDEMTISIGSEYD